MPGTAKAQRRPREKPCIITQQEFHFLSQSMRGFPPCCCCCLFVRPHIWLLLHFKIDFRIGEPQGLLPFLVVFPCPLFLCFQNTYGHHETPFWKTEEKRLLMHLQMASQFLLFTGLWILVIGIPVQGSVATGKELMENPKSTSFTWETNQAIWNSGKKIRRKTSEELPQQFRKLSQRHHFLPCSPCWLKQPPPSQTCPHTISPHGALSSSLKG